MVGPPGPSGDSQPRRAPCRAVPAPPAAPPPCPPGRCWEGVPRCRPCSGGRPADRTSSGRRSMSGSSEGDPTWPPLRLARMCCEHGSVRVVRPPRLAAQVRRPRREDRCASSFDVHRDFCEVAISRGGKACRAGRVAARPGSWNRSRRASARTIAWCWRRPATRSRSPGSSNRASARVVSRARARAQGAGDRGGQKVNADAIDACTLAELRADLVPRVWVGDERTRLLRRLVSRRRSS